MPTSKKPRKKRPATNQIQQRRTRRQTQQCRLYRWEKGDHNQGYFDVFGPFSREKNLALMDQAISRRQPWLLVVTSYFLTAEGDYYEEQLTSGPHYWTVDIDFDEIRDLIEAAVTDTRGSGNHREYEDTCSALFPYSEALVSALDNDTISSQQAGVRAEAALQKRAMTGT